MDKIIFLAILTAVLFGIVKFVEIKYMGSGSGSGSGEEKKGLKFIVRDSFIVFGATAVVCFVFEYFNIYVNDFFNVVTETNHFIPTDAPVFTGNPDF